MRSWVRIPRATLEGIILFTLGRHLVPVVSTETKKAMPFVPET
jgi:hypothetical protein